MEYCEGKNLKNFIKEHNENNELIEEDIIYNKTNMYRYKRNT